MSLGPQELERLYHKAIQSHQSGDFKKAEQVYRQIITHAPHADPIYSNLGAALLAQGKPKKALKELNEALKLNPDNLDALNNMAAAQSAMGDMPKALKAYTQLIQKLPENPMGYFGRGNLLLGDNRLDEALVDYEKANKLSPDDPAININLGSLYIKLNRPTDAKLAFKACVQAKPDYTDAHYNLGNTCLLLGSNEEAATHFRQCLRLQPGHPQALDALQSLQAHLGDEVLQGVATDPSNGESPQQPSGPIDYKMVELKAEGMTEREYNHRRALAGLLPYWHFAMLADERRNIAYQKAIEKAVKPDSVVLDIGTGSGLLSMMAARAGAIKVIACELNETLASTATTIVADNGFQNTIKVFNKKSNDLDVKKDMGARADLLVSEILDTGLLGEEVIPSHRHAVANLLKPGAQVIPSHAKVYAILMECEDFYQESVVTEVCGFNLRSFDRFRVPECYTIGHLERLDYEALTDEFYVEHFDFKQLQPETSYGKPIEQRVTVPITANGKVQAIAFWFDLFLDEEIMVSSRLGGELKHWGQAVSFFDEPKAVQEGEELDLKVLISDSLIRFRLPKDK